MGMKIPYCFDVRAFPSAYVPSGSLPSPSRAFPTPPLANRTARQTIVTVTA